LLLFGARKEKTRAENGQQRERGERQLEGAGGRRGRARAVQVRGRQGRRPAHQADEGGRRDQGLRRVRRDLDGRDRHVPVRGRQGQGGGQKEGSLGQEKRGRMHARVTWGFLFFRTILI